MRLAARLLELGRCGDDWLRVCVSLPFEGENVTISGDAGFGLYVTPLAGSAVRTRAVRLEKRTSPVRFDCANCSSATTVFLGRTCGSRQRAYAAVDVSAADTFTGPKVFSGAVAEFPGQQTASVAAGATPTDLHPQEWAATPDARMLNVGVTYLLCVDLDGDGPLFSGPVARVTATALTQLAPATTSTLDAADVAAPVTEVGYVAQAADPIFLASCESTCVQGTLRSETLPAAAISLQAQRLLANYAPPYVHVENGTAGSSGTWHVRSATPEK